MELKIGMKFTSKWFVGITEILDINKDENTLDVEIHRASGHNHLLVNFIPILSSILVYFKINKVHSR